MSSGAWLASERRREGSCGGEEKTLTTIASEVTQRRWPFPVAVFRFVLEGYSQSTGWGRLEVKTVDPLVGRGK